MIAHALWKRLYGEDPRVLSRSITLNGRLFRVVGVAPEGFTGLNTLYAADVWVPVTMYPHLFPAPAMAEQRRALLFSVVGRLKPGLTRAQAQSGLQPLAQELERQYPEDNQGRRVRLTSISEAALATKTRAAAADAGTVLMTVSGLVLLIACVNVAHLLLARAAGRNKEITVRLALGSSRWRIVRQLLAETVVLSLLGAAAGLVFARWARDLFWAIRPPVFKYAGFNLGFDAGVFGYTLAVAVGTGLLFGLIPALRATRSDLATDLKERTGQAASAWRSRYRSVLVAAQVAFSVVILVGAMLFIRSIRSVARIDLGFDWAKLATVGFNVGDQGYSEARGRDYQRAALAVGAGTPGVVSAALSKDAAFRVSSARTVLAEGDESTASGTGRVTLTTVVSPGYFQTLGIPLLRGRDLSERDTPAAPRVAIVNEAAAAHFWSGQDSIGKVIRFFGDPLPAQVIGVARNATYQTIGETPPALIYLSLAQYYFPSALVYLRTDRNPGAVAAAVKRNIQPLDRNFILTAEPVDQRVRNALWAQRLSAALLSVFGGLALILASVGIYGVIGHSVNQRVREFGVRMALGATGRDVQRMVVLEALGTIVTGVLAGTAVALALSQMVGSMLFGIGPRDTLTFVLVPCVLTAVAVLACWMPVRRITRIDPARALREE